MSAAERDPGHPAAAELLAWLDGELPEAEDAALGRHVDACPVCRAELERIRGDVRVFREAVARLDGPAAGGSASGGQSAEGVGAVRRRSARRRWMRPTAAAAVLVLLLAGAAAALVPGSPVRGWLARTLGPGDPAPGEAGGAAGSVDGAEPAPMVSRLSMRAPDSLDVLLDAPSRALELHVVRSDGTELRVETREGEGLERLDLSEGRIHVGPGDAGLLRLVLPRSVRARVLVGGEVVVPADGGARAVPPGTADSLTVVRVGPGGVR